jgi:indolepyruvate ferredoxin oxidoreductase
VDVVARVAAVERERIGTTAFDETVAVNLHKLMAYKDEYEVARLHLDPVFQRLIEREFGVGARVRWHLHPPILRALGIDRTWRFGSWFTPAYRLLHMLRRLRFTPLDPFGRAEVRRVERALIDEYRETVAPLLARLDPVTHASACEIAADMIRGYERIKVANVERYRARLAEQSAALASGPRRGNVEPARS